MQHKETKIIIAICITLLLAASLCIIAETAAAETIGTENLHLETPLTAHAGDTVKIPVTLTGYPRGINQYSIEFKAQAPGITANDFTVSLDKTMIQHSVQAEPAASADTICYRFIQTVKMAAFEDYGVEETAIGTISLHLPETDSAYDAVISARIIETTSGAPLESLAAPKTGDITIHVTNKPAQASAPASTPDLKLPLILIMGLAAALIFSLVIVNKKRRKH